MREKLIKALMKGTKGQVYVCSLKNDRSDPDGPIERHVLTRDMAHVNEFVDKWDIAGRGVFICASTLKPKSRRVKSNAMEKPFAHVDIDTKAVGLSMDEIRDRLLGLERPPTFIVYSGHGVHAYWEFDVPQASDEDIEALDRRLAAMLGGDRQVAQRVALMRLPGSHNTKNGEWFDVTIVHEADCTYDVINLREWADVTPTQIEKLAPDPVDEEDDNPFLRYAKEYAFKAPLNVEDRLSEMEYQGVGDKSVHATQVAVTASMMAAGYDLEEIVEKVMTATKAIAPDNWNWKEEEKTIRGMCKSWGKKLEKKAAPVSNVVNLNEARAQKMADAEPADTTPKKDKKNLAHVVLGKGFLAALKKRGDAMLICREEVWRCIGGLWRSLPPGEAKTWLDREIEEGCRALKMVSTQKIVNEARAWIMRNPEIYFEEVQWDSHGKVACKSGLLDPKTFEIEEAKPEHYVTMRIECFYDPKAKCPRWHRMLDDIFPGDKDTMAAIQEIAGTGLLLNRPRQLMRALIIVGAPMSGKSNLINVLSGMFSNSPNTTSFDMLENAHGTVDFLRNVPWVLHEAFDQAKWHFSAIVKSLLSGDPISVNIKNGPMVERRFKLPVFWGTNSPPQFKEASRAIETRVRIVKCKQVFDPSITTGIAREAHDKGYASPSEYVLDTEMPGLLNWFLEGMKRAVARGYLADTEEMLQSAKDLRTSSNFMTGFFEDAVDHSSSFMVAVPDLIAAVHTWFEENRGESHRLPSSDMIMKNIESLYDARIAVNSKELRFNLKRYVAGIKLNATGMDLWEAKFNASAAKGEAIRISAAKEDVNKKIPDEWYDKPIIMKMVDAHKEKNK